MIKNIQKEEIPELVKIWNKFSHILTSSHTVHTVESMEKWFDTRKETNHVFYGVHVDEKLQGFAAD